MKSDFRDDVLEIITDIAAWAFEDGHYLKSTRLITVPDVIGEVLVEREIVTWDEFQDEFRPKIIARLKEVQ